MLPTSPTMFKCLKGVIWSCVSSFVWTSSSSKPGHSDLNLSAPVKLPSPPQMMMASMPLRTMFCRSCERFGLEMFANGSSPWRP